MKSHFSSIKQIPGVLKKLRKYVKYSCAVLGKKLGVDRVTVWRTENGKREMTLTELDQYCDKLGAVVEIKIVMRK